MPNYYVERYEHQYEHDAAEKPSRVRRLFGLGKDEPLPAKPIEQPTEGPRLPTTNGGPTPAVHTEPEPDTAAAD